jgi:hypothetical protein
MRGPNQAQVFLLLFGLALSPTPVFSQLLSCATIQGDWTWYYSRDQYILSQDGKGNITGYSVSNFCPGLKFPITGTINSGSFTFTATGFNQCPGGGAACNVYWLCRPTGVQLRLRELDQLLEPQRWFRPGQRLPSIRLVCDFREASGRSDLGDVRNSNRRPVEHRL